jgi:hypothetical protein
MAKHFERQGKSPYMYHSVCSLSQFFRLSVIYVLRFLGT